MSPATLDRTAIEARIPHRPPFLFLDRIVELGASATPPVLTAEWLVPESADFFRGHYPGNPITPGVILCEHAFQAAAILLSELDSPFGSTSDVPVLARIEKAKFKRMVRPGETLRTVVQRVEAVGPAHYLEASSTVAGTFAFEVRCVLSRVQGSAR